MLSSSLKSVLKLRILPIQIHNWYEHTPFHLLFLRFSLRLLFRPVPHLRPWYPVPARTFVRFQWLFQRLANFILCPSNPASLPLTILHPMNPLIFSEKAYTYLWNFVIPDNNTRHKNSNIMLSLICHNIIRSSQEFHVPDFQTCFFEYLADRAVGKGLAIFEVAAGKLMGACVGDQ
jgi:hypothetical protein